MHPNITTELKHQIVVLALGSKAEAPSFYASLNLEKSTPRLEVQETSTLTQTVDAETPPTEMENEEKRSTRDFTLVLNTMEQLNTKYGTSESGVNNI